MEISNQQEQPEQPSTMTEENLEYPLHRCVFSNDITKLTSLLESKSNDISEKDKHGNTALHLAVMIGRKEMVDLLLAHGAQVRHKNLNGWSAIAEAVSYGNRETLLSLVSKRYEQSSAALLERRPMLFAGLSKIDDFYMELRWDFHTWLPLISRLLPSDICKIQKRGSSIRFDSTLIDFNDMRWERGDVTCLYDSNAPCEKAFIVMDNIKKVYQIFDKKENGNDIEDEVDLLLSTDTVSVQMSTKLIEFTRAQSGWIFKEDRQEMIGPFNSSYYNVNGLCLETRKRREHLSEEDLQRNKALLEIFTGSGLLSDSSGGSGRRRESLPPPDSPSMTWEEYIDSEPGKHPSLGRPVVVKQSTRTYKATVAMSTEFPLSTDLILNVLEVIAPMKHFTKLREFVQLKLPPGFPVKFDIPLLPTICAKVTFQEFKFVDNFEEDMFKIPDDYKEDPSRFPDF